MSSSVCGRVYRCGDEVFVFDIIPQRYKSSNNLDSRELGGHVFEDLDPEFAERAQAGEFQIVVAGRNFGGGGKSIEGPVWALKGAGIQLVVADSVARYFFRNAINNGLPVIVCSGISQRVETGDDLTVDLRSGMIRNVRKGTSTQGVALSQAVLGILAEGGAIPYTKKRLAAST